MNKENINILKNDLKNCENDYKKNQIYEKFCKDNNLNIVNTAIILEIFKHEQTFFRVTRQLNETMNDFSNFIYPPLYKCTVGRANIKNKQVLYTNINDIGAIKECKIKENEYFYLSEWKLNKDIHAHIFFSNYYKDQEFNNLLKLKKEELFHNYNQNNIPYSQEETYNFMLFQGDSFFTDIEDKINSENSYILSSFFSNNILYNYELNKHVKKIRNKAIGAIIYPSIADNEKSINYAFSNKIIKNIDLTCIKKCIYHGNDSYTIINIGFHDKSNNKIYWLNEDNKLFKIQTIYNNSLESLDLYCENIKITWT